MAVSNKRKRLAISAIVLALAGGTVCCQTWQFADAITVDSPVPTPWVAPAEAMPLVSRQTRSDVAPASYIPEAAANPFPNEEPIGNLMVPAASEVAALPCPTPPQPDVAAYRPQPVKVRVVDAGSLEQLALMRAAAGAGAAPPIHTTYEDATSSRRETFTRLPPINEEVPATSRRSVR